MSTMTVTQRAMAASSSSATASIMLPTSSDVSPSELESFSRIVRFDSECVLIPDMNRTKSPKMITKSYSLPLWKRRTSNPDTETSGGEEASMAPVSEETHVVLNIPIPTFITRASRSPTRGRRSASMSPSAASKPLSPCLVQRTPSASPVSHNKRPLAPMRRPSLPIYHRPKDQSALTVPLRACCLDCERITEECLQEGDHWKEKFTKAARRRRSASLDNATPYTPPGSAGFAAVAAVSGGGTVSSAVIPTSRPGKFALTVDEVDKRRKSQEITLANEDLTCKRTLSTPNPSTSYCPGVSPYNAVTPALRQSRPRNSDFSSGSTSSSSSDNSPLSISTSPLESLEKRKPRSSPIPEEDEAQLFPLPKKSPSNSPSASLNHSPRSSPLPSPNGSTAFLPVAVTCAIPTHAAALRSKDSLSSRGSNDEDGKLKGSLSRKCSKGLLVPPDHTHRSGSTGAGTAPESPVLPKPFFESPLSSPTLLSSPSDLTARPVPIHTSSSPGTSSTVPEASPSPTGHKHGLSLHLHFPARHHSTSNAPSAPAPSAALPSPTSPSFSHRQAPGSPKQRKPSITHQFVRAGEAMLKGVSSIGGGGGVVGGV